MPPSVSEREAERRGDPKPPVFLRRATLQQRQLLAGRNLIEMFGVAPRLNVQVGFIARRALRLHGIVLVLRGQLLDAIEDLLAGQKALLDPSRRAACSAHFGEAPVVVEHFHALAVLYHSGFFIHRRNVVAQVGLHAGNVGDLQHASASAIAARKNGKRKTGMNNKNRWKMRFTGSLSNITRARFRRG